MSGAFIYGLWGKTDPFNSLICHMIDVGSTAQVLISNACFKNLRNRLMQEMGTDEQTVVEWIGFILALHDIGKCHPDFQGKIDCPLNDELRAKNLMKKSTTSEGVREFRHESYVWEWGFDYLLVQCAIPKETVRILLTVLSLHHWRYTDVQKIDSAYKPFWLDLQNELADTLKPLFITKEFQGQMIKHKDIFSTLLEGLLILSDWIASNAEMMPFSDREISDPYAYYRESMDKAVRAINVLGLDVSNGSAFGRDFLDVWPEIKENGFKPRPIQEVCEKLCQDGSLVPKLVIIEAPMGEGKTEAAIYTAIQWLRDNKAHGFFVALPTSATSNQMYGRIQDLFSQHQQGSIDIKLVHGLAWLIDKDGPQHNLESRLQEEREERELAFKWFQPSRRALLAPFGIGTVDQAMMAALFVKFGVLRLLGLSNKVLIIDEVHAYDTFMSTIIERLLNWCGVMEVPVIMLSATLPQTKKRQLAAAYGSASVVSATQNSNYPMITWIGRDGEFIEKGVEGSSVNKDVEITLEYGRLSDWEYVAGKALSDIEKGGCLCIIVNTVKEAQKLYEHLKIIADNNVQLMLFHARFCVEDRERIERTCINLFDKRSLLPKDHSDNLPRPRQAILVATQVVEQSLDIDFDIMYSAIAPIDLILQRMGRLHRHKRENRPTGNTPVFRILLPGQDHNFGSTGKVYEEYVLNKTVNCLKAWGKIVRIPLDIKPMVEEVYTEDYVNLNEQQKILLQRMKDRETHDQVKGKEHLIRKPNPKNFWIADQLGQEQVQREDSSISYFHAQTRLGSETFQLLLLEETEWKLLRLKINSLSKNRSRQILQKMVLLPIWWLHEVASGEGYREVEKIENGVLKGYRVLSLVEGVWRGIDKFGREVKIHRDQELGITWERM